MLMVVNGIMLVIMIIFFYIGKLGHGGILAGFVCEVCITR